jgi:hypothetical protein
VAFQSIQADVTHDKNGENPPREFKGPAIREHSFFMPEVMLFIPIIYAKEWHARRTDAA